MAHLLQNSLLWHHGNQPCVCECVLPALLWAMMMAKLQLNLCKALFLLWHAHFFTIQSNSISHGPDLMGEDFKKNQPDTFRLNWGVVTRATSFSYFQIFINLIYFTYSSIASALKAYSRSICCPKVGAAPKRPPSLSLKLYPARKGRKCTRRRKNEPKCGRVKTVFLSEQWRVKS